MSIFTPELITILMFLSLIVGLFMGYYLAFVLAGVGLLFGFAFIGTDYIGTLITSFFGVMQNSVLLAIPLFVLMGNILEQTGAGERIFNSFYVLFGRIKGGLLVATNFLATLFAATTGVVGASVVTMGTLSLPPMLSRGYDKKLASGIIVAGGGLGVLIPPSIMIVVYGPVAGVSVGSLFMAAIVPGLLLSITYTIYVLVRCHINPKLGPPISKEDRKAAFERIGIKGLILSLAPPLVIILAVLGSIFFGIATPTEAAAVGVVAAIVLALFHRELKLEKLKTALDGTLTTTAMILTMTVGAVMFISTFSSIGGINIVKNFVTGLPFDAWGILTLMIVLVVILGMFLDWIGIVYLVVPLFTPIAMDLGFNAIWFSMIIILFLQLSYITPPFALSIFYFKGVAPPDISTSDMYKAVIPFIGLQVIVFSLCIAFPKIILWLPELMMK
ncbi:TRAP transporter large permease [Sporosarcina sp. FA9]|uniref:TRAP transporter large permease n=1 Tax=Sporosarcina sp. FA9 TaxID=3413030 RepID=UPI003F654E55